MECTKCRREIVDGAAFCPYCGEKVAEEAKPLYTAEVKGLLKSGTLAVYADRVEFITSNVQRMVIVYSTLVSVKGAGPNRVYDRGRAQRILCR